MNNKYFILYREDTGAFLKDKLGFFVFRYDYLINKDIKKDPLNNALLDQREINKFQKYLQKLLVYESADYSKNLYVDSECKVPLICNKIQFIYG